MSKNQKIDLTDFLTSPLRDEETTSFVSNLFNRFLSEEQSVRVSGQVGKITDTTQAVISAPDLDREQNALIPALYFKTGTEDSLYTFDDILNKMEALGIDTNDLKGMLAEQTYNYAPPINFDKFVNFSNYWWVGQVPPVPVMAWNPDCLPEHYVIARPARTSIFKMPVKLATTRDVKLWGKDRPREKITLTFTNSTTFTISGDQGVLYSRTNDTIGAENQAAKVLTGPVTSLHILAPDATDVLSNGYGRDDPTTTNDELVTFSITQGIVPFQTGDEFEVDIEYATGNSIISFTPAVSDAGKGFISNIVVDSRLMFVDGVRLNAGDSVLVWQQNNPEENGIYTVKPGKWVRRINNDQEQWLPQGSLVYVLRNFGSNYSGYTFELTSREPDSTFVLDDPTHGALTFSVQSTIAPSPVNDWQAYNFWVHFNDLTTEQKQYAIQSTRPILEYRRDIQLNKFVDSDGYPSLSGFSLTQRKTKFNQLPQFDLFRYDGTHARKTSSLFFYAEDPDFPLDVVLQRRVKTTVNSDYVFSSGITDENDRLMYFKQNGALQTIWVQGVVSPEATTPVLTAPSAGTKGTLTVNTISVVADNQQWSATCLTPTTFRIEGTRAGVVGTATVGPLFTTDDLTLTIAAGATPFAADDKFDWTVRAEVTPRYVRKNSEGKLVNFLGGPAADTNEEGTWLVPRRMFENVPRLLSTDIEYGNILDHGRSVIKAQTGFQGSSFGVNNFRQLTTNLGYGGLIREHGSNFPLLLSMLIQKDVSPLTILDFAQSQYNSALSSVDTFLSNELVNFITEKQAFTIASISAAHADTIALLSYFEADRATNESLKEVFGDTTAGVANWPITLPMMGMLPRVNPIVSFDNELGLDVIIHHDGHISPLAEQNIQFERTLAATIVTRSDDAKTPGAIQTTAPTNPYARQLWFNTTSNKLFVFDVVSDADETPEGGAGLYWYKRSATQLYEWNTTSLLWETSVTALSTLWKEARVSTIRNSLLLAIEKKLYSAVSQDMVDDKIELIDVENEDIAEIEFAKFAAKYNYDLYAPDYSASDAFTWNYSNATISGVTAGTARWFDIYKDYFDQPGTSLPTARPNLEPWKLLNFSTKPGGWDASYADLTMTRLWNNTMWADIAAARPGLKLCVNTLTDELLPPYVALSNPASSNALLTAIPTGISDGYEFGDNGPVEIVWKKSLDYFYGLARVYFKLHPLEFLDKTWGETYFTANSDQIRVERNLQRPLPPSKFLLHGEKLNLIEERNLPYHFDGGYEVDPDHTVRFVVSHVENNETFFLAYINDVLQGTFSEGEPFTLGLDETSFEATIFDRGIPFNLGDVIEVTSVDEEPFFKFIPSLTKKFLGLGQLFTNLLRFNFIDTDISDATNAYRGWSVKLAHRIGGLIRGDSLSVDAAGVANIADTAYSLILKRSTNVDSKWISALRIQLVQAGTRIPTAEGRYIPVGEGTDWIFRIESYNPQHPILEHYTLDTGGDFTTFHALDKQSTNIAWKHYTEKTGLTTTTTPLSITGVQNVLNFVFGYIDRLQEQGWLVNAGERVTIDAETGRNLDWQLEVEKFVDRVYRSLGPGEGHILNPFMEGLWLDTPIGLMSRYSEKQFIDNASVQAAYDIGGAVIPVDNLEVIRTDERAVTYSDTPIFSAHVFRDEFEHVILFNNTISSEVESLVLFDPFLGLRISTAFLSYTRQDELDRKPRFDGFVLSGNDVKRNIVSSVDAISNYYDSIKTFNEPSTAEHALALLGFNKKDYFNDIGSSDATQFNFWRGLIQAKGTNMTIDAFVNYKKFSNAAVDEYWAYKLASYGDNRTRISPEIKIEVADSLQRFTQLQFFDANDTSYVPLPLFTQIEHGDDARWFGIDDLGKGLEFPAQEIEVVLDSLTAGYYRLSDIFHNGDVASPTLWLRTTVYDNNGIFISETDTAASPTNIVIINASLIKIKTTVTPPANTTYQYVVKGFTWKNQSKLAPIKLFNYKEQTLEKDITLWHPAIGIHSYEPLDLVHTISSINPALYNTTRQTTNNPNYVRTKPWGKREVGRVWWNTSNLGYLPYYDATVFPDRNERHARWGTTAEWATVDLYEWIESSVPPSEYDALAAEEEGQSDIPTERRLSGTAALKTYYSRERTITARPIAWSHAGVGSSDAHPSFGPAYLNKLWVAGGAVYIDSGRVNEVDFTAGKHLGAWKDDKPVGEVIIGSDLVYHLGSATSLTPQIAPAGLLTSITPEPIDQGRFGAAIGQISLRLVRYQVEHHYLDHIRMTDAFGAFEDVRIEDWELNMYSGRIIQFHNFGIQLRVVRDTISETYKSEDFGQDLADSWINVFVREGVRCTQVIELPDVVLINDPEDPEISTYEYGWKSWEVPTQAELDADLLFPRNSWSPYVGNPVAVDATVEVVDDIKNASLVLKNGIGVGRYAFTWSNWVPLTGSKIEKISNGVSAVSFAKSEFISIVSQRIDFNRISIYVNGILISPKNYVEVGELGQESIELVNTLPEGTSVLLIHRAYQPTDEELAFDPDIEDDASIQTEYKVDYQYTKVDVRNEVGSFTESKYYFWVENTTVVKPNKSMSLVQAKKLLTTGPSQFAVFAQMNERKAFDSCMIAGLNSLVTNNDTYKLRFLVNETLRDDPEQLALKNVHTEWALLRRSQSAKIPAQLWALITNAAAGEDEAGVPLPFQVRVDYDARNGTRSRFGFAPGQIFADTDLVRKSIVNTILNTSLVIKVGDTEIPDTIVSLNFDESDEWFATPTAARNTMNLIWSSGRAKQINEIFFEVLEDALANNYEFSDIFKTSYISVYSTSQVASQVEAELEDGQF
jgi:hypothetical protein